MEPGSFTSEPQYQRPDQRNSDIDYVRRPEPIVPAQPMGGAVPVPAGYAYDGSLAKRLLIIWRNWPMHCWILRMVQRKIIRYCFIFNLRILLSFPLCLLYNSRMVFYK